MLRGHSSVEMSQLLCAREDPLEVWNKIESGIIWNQQGRREAEHASFQQHPAHHMTPI